MKAISLVLGFMLIMSILSAPEADLANLPDYPYKDSKIFSGYLEVKDHPGRKLHYVFVEKVSAQPLNEPLTLWLNGGPGCSSLLGFAEENGPAVFTDDSPDKLVVNEKSWHKASHMLYLEAPAGVGFSTAETAADRRNNDTQTAIDNLNALLYFFSEKFPEYKKNKFYITGESYGGIYIPTLANNILKHNQEAQEADKINLVGFAIGNGLTSYDLDLDNALVDFAYYHALYSWEMREEVDRFCGTTRPVRRNFQCAHLISEINRLMSNVFAYDIYRDPNLNSTNNENTRMTYPYTKFFRSEKDEYDLLLEKNNIFKFLENHSVNTNEFRPEFRTVGYGGSSEYFNRKDVKQALHVNTNLIFRECGGIYYTSDLKDGTLPLYPDLIKSNLKIMIYSGDSDAVVPFTGTRAWIDTLKLKVNEKNRAWFVDNNDKSNVAGFVTKYEGLKFVTVKGTGHMVPQWKRAEAYHMIETFIQDKDI